MVDVGSPLPSAPWGSLLGVYLVLIGIASGVTLIGLWLRAADVREAQRIERFTAWISLFALGLSGAILVFDLGKPFRFFLMLTEFGTLGSSPMAVGAKLIAAKLGLLILNLYLLGRRDEAIERGELTLAAGWTERVYRIVPALLGALSLALAVYPATLLSRTWSSPLAASPGAPILFLSTALLLGVGVMLLASRLDRAPWGHETVAQLERLFLLFLAAQAILLGFEALTAPRALSWAYAALLSGSSGLAFWGLVVALGLGLPLLGTWLWPRHRTLAIASALAALVGASTSRFLFLIVR